MQDGFIFQNNFKENENEDNFFNLNLPFQNYESSFPNMQIFNQEIINKQNENNNIDELNNNIFQIQTDNINNINKDLSFGPNPIPFKENPIDNCDNLFEKENNLNLSDSQLQSNSTKGSGEKSNKSKIDKDEINKKSNLGKKRKTRIHLEDLNIDPEIIKCKKYQTIGDKVITSKNSKITDLDRKEIRAIRNRISAQKSRDRKKAEFNE